MKNVATITWLTFHEAWRRRMVLLALVLGVLFVLVFSVGFWLITSNLNPRESEIQRRFTYSLLLSAGLYVTHFLTVMLAIFASVDTISGEIASHTIQAIVTKPVRRWHV